MCRTHSQDNDEAYLTIFGTLEKLIWLNYRFRVFYFLWPIQDDLRNETSMGVWISSQGIQQDQFRQIPTGIVPDMNF